MGEIEPTTVYEQLATKCNCIGSVEQSDVEELINLISLYTCWTQKPCETFLSGERREVLELPDCMDECEVFSFTPFYHPFDKESFAFTLIAQKGTEEETTEITDFSYSEIDDDFKMVLPIPNCRCNCRNKCDCPTKYKLLVTYVAGYDLLPDCMIPLMCEALQYIKEKNKCDCSKCTTCDNKYENDQVPILVDDADTITLQLKNYFIRVLSNQYKRQLSLISLCERQNELWGFRV